MSQTIIIKCDVCESDVDVKADVQIPVTFTTEQTEGRSVEPYITRSDPIDICLRCIKRLTEEQPIYACGAQGHNSYKFRVDKTEVDN